MTAVREQPEVDLDRLIDWHQATVWRYLRYLGASATDADDLTQETFLAVAKSKFEYHSSQQSAAYLRTVARNQLLMARRRAGREINTVELESAEQVWAETVGEHGMNHFLETLADCLQKVEGRALTVLEHFYQDGMARQAIADTLGMKPGGVKTLLRRTRDVLRKCIERQTP